MSTHKHFIIDFDSTFTKVEALDELCAICIPDPVRRQKTLAEIQRITDLGMEGEIPLVESLDQRLALLNANKSHLTSLIEHLKSQISESFKTNRAFFEAFKDDIYIISNGFKEFIVPIVRELGVKPENVFANTFTYDEEGNITGFDRTNPLTQNQGKAKQIKALNLPGEVYVIGDGYTDYEIKEAGIADKFYAFTENVSRDSVVDKADHVTPSLDEFLYVNKLPSSLSYPKNRIKVLVLEGIHEQAVNMFKEEGYQVEFMAGALEEEELCEKLQDVSILCIRSKTHVTAKALEHAPRLMAVGAFCIGTNQIDLAKCTERGIVVFNAPYSNTRSVVEMAIGEIIMLSRGLVEKSNRMHAGDWDKSAKGSNEIRGKKLGIIGYGNIGSQLSVLAESLGMDVYFYDVVDKLALGNAKVCHSLAELLALADIVTLHVDGRASNKNIIGTKEFELMKPGVLFLNLARGHVVDIEALAQNIKSGKIRGCAVDVFPHEPKNNQEKFESALRGLPNTLLSPHVGGSTEEAQENIAQYVPSKMIDYVNTGGSYNSVNFPNLQLPALGNAHRLIHIHRNVPGILAKINNVLAENNINILGQYLKTNETIGYVITDVDTQYDRSVIKKLKHIPDTIKSRALY
ncbi:3-phosphoglycerate dehydrogenase [Rufibacter radiotolerans]|uniref:D-3-phosphoglycerate dehydrogenase n=1 Tax=Rufibacter radiotolerans TaxID=1379910 RepID=A0A0H4W9X4_9BACT|nr:phosphoglycerate dehydrogenase [Rufibacter radiotolerans]AKQ47276.1 3-phosphoglycerate dehydrogenase [Rufibacter radiotolerans]